MNQQRTIRLENVGPIDRLSIPLPDAGVVVLRGRNGAGKSHALAAVDSLIGGRGRPPCKDGARKGLVEGVGAKITIGRSTRRTGEAEVVTLEGRLDISQLVQPPIKDEEAADRQRIKALIQLSGQPADAETFKPILPPEVEIGELVSVTDLKRDDPVTLAGKIKRALEAEARRHEKAAENLNSKAAGLQAEIDEHSISLNLDRKTTEAELQAALVALKELETRAEESQRRRSQAEKARQTLEQLRSKQPADQSIEALEAEETNLDEKIEKLQRALAVAQERRHQVRRQLDQARLVQSQIKQLEEILAEVPEAVPPDQILAAQDAVAEAQLRHNQAIEAERLRDLKAQADQYRESADKAAAEAERFRNAAHATDEVLNELVSHVTSKLHVEGGRLVCHTDRGIEPFSELSPGERWRVALEIALEQVGHGGLVTVPQECWEGLDPVNRAEVAEIARSVGVVILTAEADEKEHIEAIPFDPHHREARAAAEAVKEGPR